MADISSYILRPPGRELRYRFSAHFHPYVDELVRRLVEGSVGGLQAADTDYAVNPDGTLKALPNTTMAAVADDAMFPDGSPMLPLQGTPVPLPDGTLVHLPSGKQALLPGDIVWAEPQALRVFVASGEIGPGTSLQEKEAIAFGTSVTLVNDMTVTLPNGSTATIKAGKPPLGRALTLQACKPQPKLYEETFFEQSYSPSELVQQPYPVKDLDFTTGGAYAVYNWELFFHVPLTIAIHLSRNQRFEEAMSWFHLIFDPTDASDGPTPERFWKVKPFQSTDVKLIEEILVNLSTGIDPALHQATISAIRAWESTPFRPHLVARYRHPAYMFKAVMAYLDNLIAWGDSLFREDTGESINEAMQLYVLAANILGPRPQVVPKKALVPSTYANLRQELDRFDNALMKLQDDIPSGLLPHPGEAGNLDQFSATLRSIGNSLYFCVPRNDKLLSYWDTVADRLFKIRNSLNLLGTFRQLPLFEPPIDPALLARAAAAGVDVAAIVNGLNQPLPLVRFQLLLQKALEIVQEVKSLGNTLLAAIEKEDGEALAILRAKHERLVMEMVEHVKYLQAQEATKSLEGLFKSLALPLQRYFYYERQLGKKFEEIAQHAIADLDPESLAKMKLLMTEPEIETREIEIEIAQDLRISKSRIFNNYERNELVSMESAMSMRREAADQDRVAKYLSLIPEFGSQLQPLGIGAVLQFGGRALSTQIAIEADRFKTEAEGFTHEAGLAAKLGSYARREQDWALQSNQAAGEINQIFKQIRAAQLRQAIAEQELANHKQQMKQAEEIKHFLNEEGTEKTGKKTNKAFYVWMQREVRGLYGQCFQFAFDIARKAERALQHELGNSELSYLQFGYLAGNEGLLAGEKLYLDIKRMEMAYHDLNQREHELTKHVSLLQVDPLALMQLRSTGRCTVRLDEDLFDMDGPGHYFRRIKTVAVSFPCVTGPYTSVNCTLTLLKSSIRKTPVVDEHYAREDAEDSRFSDYFGSLQSIVTSSAQNDSGLFETNLRDERYLPFEYSGAISEWQLELPANPSKHEPRQFDYDTISDVILHIRYTAREGGGLLRSGALANLKARIDQAQAAGSVRLFALRHEFPTEWAKFQSQPPDTNQRFELALNLRPEHYPFWSQGRLNSVSRVDILARSTATQVTVFDSTGTQKGTLEQDGALGNLLHGSLPTAGLPATPHGELKLFFDTKAMAELWIAVTWSGG